MKTPGDETMGFYFQVRSFSSFLNPACLKQDGELVLDNTQDWHSKGEDMDFAGVRGLLD